MRHQVDLHPSHDLSYLIGVMMGDGSAYKYEHKQKKRGCSYIAHKVALCCKDKEFADNFALLLGNIIVTRKSPLRVYYSRGYYDVLVCCKALYEFFKLGIHGFEYVIQLFPEDFIRGFFDSEGNAHVGKDARNCSIQLSNKNKELLTYIRGLLLTMGIKCFLCFDKNGGAYHLMIKHYKSMCLFASSIGSDINRKNRDLRLILEIVIRRIRYWKKMREKKEVIQSMRGKGLSTRRVARTFGVSHESVRKWWRV